MRPADEVDRNRQRTSAVGGVAAAHELPDAGPVETRGDKRPRSTPVMRLTGRPMTDAACCHASRLDSTSSAARSLSA